MVGRLDDLAIWSGFLLDTLQTLEEAIVAMLPSASQERDGKYDRAIDREYGMIEVAGQSYDVSELLFTVDYIAYCDLGGWLRDAFVDVDNAPEDKPL